MDDRECCVIRLAEVISDCLLGEYVNMMVVTLLGHDNMSYGTLKVMFR